MRFLLTILLLLLACPVEAPAQSPKLKETIQRSLPRVIRALKLFRPSYAALSDEAVLHQSACEEASRYMGALLEQAGIPVRLVYGKGHYWLQTVETKTEGEIMIDLTFRQFLKPTRTLEDGALVAKFREKKVPAVLLTRERDLPEKLDRFVADLGLDGNSRKLLTRSYTKTLSSVNEIRSTHTLMEINNSHFRSGERGVYDNQYAVLEGLSAGALGVGRSYLVQTAAGRWKTLYEKGFEDLHGLAIDFGRLITGLETLKKIPSGRAGIFLAATLDERIVYAPAYLSSAYVHSYYATTEELKAKGIELYLDSDVEQLPLGPLALALEFSLPKLSRFPPGQVTVQLGPASDADAYDLSPHLFSDDCNAGFRPQ